jgi:hypothetical protein
VGWFFQGLAHTRILNFGGIMERIKLEDNVSAEQMDYIEYPDFETPRDHGKGLIEFYYEYRHNLLLVESKLNEIVDYLNSGKDYPLEEFKIQLGDKITKRLEELE